MCFCRNLRTHKKTEQQEHQNKHTNRTTHIVFFSFSFFFQTAGIKCSSYKSIKGNCFASGFHLHLLSALCRQNKQAASKQTNVIQCSYPEFLRVLHHIVWITKIQHEHRETLCLQQINVKTNWTCFILHEEA